jgi:dimethylhistidine N-methyltransferase
MPPAYKVLRDSDFAETFNERDAFALDVLVGLSTPRKSLPSRYFYDERGSELFREITRLPEYYPTRCEYEILERHRSTIAGYIGREPFNLVEMGAGYSEKTVMLLEYLSAAGFDFRYVPIDISEDAMHSLIGLLNGQLPHLEVEGLVTEYRNGLKWLNRRSPRRNLVLFLGSSIGNFTHPEACVFMRNLWNGLNNDDLVLIGFDLKKDIDLLLRAYNDSRGVTREFNLNLLHRINRELGGRFDVRRFRHFGTYDVFSGAMESYLVSNEQQSVFIELIGRSFSFEAWEPIHTEYSYKYLPADIEQLAGETGFDIQDNFFDSRRWFTDSIWRVRKSSHARKRLAGSRRTSGIRAVRAEMH